MNKLTEAEYRALLEKHEDIACYFWTDLFMFDYSASMHRERYANMPTPEQGKEECRAFLAKRAQEHPELPESFFWWLVRQSLDQTEVYKARRTKHGVTL